MAGIYLHIPFCKKACTYCNFHFSTTLHQRPELVAALHQELIHRAGELSGQQINTIYLGGGTPSILSADEIHRLLETIFRHYDASGVQEMTLEANPDDLSASYLKALRHTPVNRFSIGVQSFREEDLRFMNRAHTATEAEASIKRAQDTGFENLTIDLIYGTPGLTDAHWRDNLNRTAAYGVPHISAYALTVEENTALDHFIRKGKTPPLAASQSADQALLLLDWAEAAGYEGYEISNFARPGHRARHNSAYWQGVPYLGIGPSAHSYDGASVRRWNLAHNSQYIQGLADSGIAPHETETLTDRDRYHEYVMTSLRRIEGIDLGTVREHWGAEAAEKIQETAAGYFASGKLTQTGTTIALTREGRLFADGIASDLFL
ncbi:MAG: radical SAM family heme chaperone HemW [Sphingobacteriales bacterium]|nr:MAG: radical SAM family heme chaperone HemW [Sphingobacteriales bacterium]